MKVNEDTANRKHTLLYIYIYSRSSDLILNELLALIYLQYKAVLHLTAHVRVTEKQQRPMKERGEHLKLIPILRNG